MKALTLTQPWATLVAIGAKTIETRSWLTNYTGPLAIHAAKGYPKSARLIAGETAFARALAPFGFYGHNLPTGVIVATCELINVLGVGSLTVGEPEKSFGDYTPGRYGWLLANIQPLAEPKPAKGALGLWEWNA